MGMVMTTCPATGQQIDTGIETDERSFARFPDFVARVFCPHCAYEHQWTKNNAWVVDKDSSK
jgi:hypothetical protein